MRCLGLWLKCGSLLLALSEIFPAIQHSLGLRYSDRPTDLFNAFVDEWRTKGGASVMPPSPGVKSYTPHWQMGEDGRFYYDTQVDWAPFVSELVQYMPSWQVTHRSRAPSIAVGSLRVAELSERLARLPSYSKYIEKFKLSDSESHAFWEIFMSSTLKHLKFSMPWVTKYIEDHKYSSILPGVKWSIMRGVSEDEFKQLFEQVKGMIMELYQHEGQYTNVRWATGMRARSERLNGFREHYGPFEIERTRIITYYPPFSIWTLFIPDKAEWYGDILNGLKKILGMRAVIHLPFFEGGRIYVTASEWFSQGYGLIANDGKSWESVVALLLGKSFNPLMLDIAGWMQLGSGSSYTSACGTAANMVFNRYLDGEVIMLGDDMNYRSDCRGIPRAAFSEYQPEDSKYRYVLGVTYAVDPLIPRLSGLKVSSDRSTKMKHIQVDLDERDQLIFTTRDSRIRAAWGGMFVGKYGDRNLIDALKETLPGEYVAASQLVDNLVEDVTESAEDYYAYAREMGISAALYA